MKPIEQQLKPQSKKEDEWRTRQFSDFELSLIQKWEKKNGKKRNRKTNAALPDQK